MEVMKFAESKAPDRN